MLDKAPIAATQDAAINVPSCETLNTAPRGFKLAKAASLRPRWTSADYVCGAAGRDALLGALALAHHADVIAEASPVLAALHIAHCPPAHVEDWLHPPMAEAERPIELGAGPLITCIDHAIGERC